MIIVNRNGFYEPLRQLLEAAIDERFIARRHADMWVFVETVEAAIAALDSAPAWSAAARSFAAL